MAFSAEFDSDARRLRLRGDCRMADAATLSSALAALPGRDVTIDLAGAGDWDIGPAVAAVRAPSKPVDSRSRRHAGGSAAASLRVLRRVRAWGQRASRARAANGRGSRALAIPAGCVAPSRPRQWVSAAAMLITPATVWRSLKRMRIPSIVRHTYETGVQAIPVVAVIAFLISVISAYIGAQQLRPFGAEIFTVDLVAIGVLRELGVLLTAIMVAGRTGSAYAAEIGVMKLNDEVDALESMGMDPYRGARAAARDRPRDRDAAAHGSRGFHGDRGRRCHDPRADRSAVAAVFRPARRCSGEHDVLGGNDQGTGVRRDHRADRYTARAEVRESSRELGRLTTVAVVQSIFLVIFADALFAVFYLRSTSDGAMTAIIRVDSIVNRFGTQVVHDGVSFEVQPGEVFGIVGGSGSGKSVLLKTILGLHRPDSGRVEVEGVDITTLDEARMRAVKQRYGVTFQQGALFTSLTVADNVMLPVREALDLDDDTLNRLVELRMRMVGLPLDAAAKYPAQLSGGMTKRAALARALALDPVLLFLDEPTAGLDPIAAAGFDDLVLYLRRALKLTVVMVTHDLDTLTRTCDRVAVLVDGHVIVDTLANIVGNDHPWIRDYFHGARGRAVLEAREGESWNVMRNTWRSERSPCSQWRQSSRSSGGTRVLPTAVRTSATRSTLPAP